MAADDPPVVRRVRADEWQHVRRLRLAALGDPDAAMAFLDSLDDARARSERFWRRRTALAAASDEAAQFIAESGDDWAGSVTVLIRPTGSRDHLGQVVESPRADVVGVYVRPAHRGRRLLDALIDAGGAWAAARGAAALTLDVHRDNARAIAAYRRCGFAPTGEEFTGPVGPELVMRRPAAG